ncbi:sensor histidine kinase [Agromyces humatus]|uniref:histidine kinase n=1 Tax=Agromyces humatus TaxID=279573 RepID=A0ABP4X881_9MICO
MKSTRIVAGSLDVTFIVVRAFAFTVVLAALLSGWVSYRREAQRRELVRARRTSEWRHEVNNALASLEGAHLLSRLESGARRDSELETAFGDELNHLAQLVAEREDRPQTTAVASVVSRCVSMRRAAGDVVDLRVEPRAKDVHAEMSDLTLAGVITNLLLNCHRHAPGAGVVVDVGRVDDRVLIAVTDDGPGLPPTATVFRNPDLDTRHPHGLGLSIVRRAVRVHGGTLNLGAGKSGRGTRATVTLPLADRAAVARSSEDQGRRDRCVG